MNNKEPDPHAFLYYFEKKYLELAKYIYKDENKVESNYYKIYEFDLIIDYDKFELRKRNKYTYPEILLIGNINML